MNTYDIFSGKELEIADLIQRRRLQLLVHSCLYYNMDTNIVSDKKWDEWAKELVKLQQEYPKISEQVIWYEAFSDWDASTGAFLPLDDAWVIKAASKFSTKRVKRKSKPPEVKATQKVVVDKSSGQFSLF